MKTIIAFSILGLLWLAWCLFSKPKYVPKPKLNHPLRREICAKILTRLNKI